jgi:hypothetical protein
VKPQFEAGREEVGKGGIVSDPDVHEAVLALRDLRSRLAVGLTPVRHDTLADHRGIREPRVPDAPAPGSGRALKPQLSGLGYTPHVDAAAFTIFARGHPGEGAPARRDNRTCSNWASG